MIINTVKLQENGYLVNNSISIPKVEGNRHYKLVKQWISEGNTPEPQFTPTELKQQVQNKTNQEAKTYLDSTDWYVTRLTETGKDIPQDILDDREKARQNIKED